MKSHTQFVALFLAIFVFAACKDDGFKDLEDSQTGQYHYLFMASIDDADIPQSRVEENVDAIGLRLHWEPDDEIVLKEEVSGQEYKFKAVKYVHHHGAYSDGSDNLELWHEGMELSTIPGEEDKIVFYFEYNGSEPIANAENFYGTATYTPRESYFNRDDKGNLLFHQKAPGDTEHLKCCEHLNAEVRGLNLTLNAGAWTTPENNETEPYVVPILMEHEHEYAYLKITTHGFKYPIEGNGTLRVYIMDETPNNTIDYYEPDAMLTFGNAGEEFISLPSDSTAYDKISGHYKGDISCVFYVPLRAMVIKPSEYALPYINVVLQCGSSGDLYVWEKKVPYDVLLPGQEGVALQGGKLYDLDYTDKRVEYAIKFVDDLIYMRSTYLEQDREGKGGSAPRFTLFGEKAVLNTSAQDPNCVLGRGVDAANPFNAADVKNMRLNSGRFVVEGTNMVSIRPIKQSYWNMDSNGNWIKQNGDLWPKGDEITKMSPYPTMSYMQKITRGIINPNSTYHAGNVWNCFEYVLLNQFDPVMNSPKTSNLWRAPYGRDLVALAHYSGSAEKDYDVCKSEIDVVNKVIKLISIKTNHMICLPILLEYKLTNAKRSTAYDGSNSEPGIWTVNASPTDAELSKGYITGVRSIRSSGSNNPAYCQTISAQVTGENKELVGIINKFDQAIAILPVFRWRSVRTSSLTKENLIPWSGFSESSQFPWEEE